MIRIAQTKWKKGRLEAKEMERKTSVCPPSTLLIDPGLVYSFIHEEFALKKPQKTPKPLLHQSNENSCETSQIKKLYTLVPSFKSHLFAIMSGAHKPGPRADPSSAPTATSGESPTCTALAQHHPFSSESSTEITGATCAKIDSFHVK